MVLLMRLANFEDVRLARTCVRDLAQAAGIHDSLAVELAAGELGNNCVEHGENTTCRLRVGCQPGHLSLRFENRSQQQPDWQTRKPVAVEEFRTGGYGLQLARSLAPSVNCEWAGGRVVCRAEFS